MKRYPKYSSDIVCNKCGFAASQMLRQYFDGQHDIIVDKAVKKCKIKDEHIHFECCCGHELIFRPLDCNTIKSKSTVKKAKVGKWGGNLTAKDVSKPKRKVK